jgi:hypothetical protein|tara:strand:- start:640 stop:891 length:252 start_codon:yes stop_codon:yes gene_type:complete
MTAQIKPLAAKVVINTSGNKSTVGNADVVYILGTAADTITNDTTGASFQIGANSPVIMHKNRFDFIYSGANTTHITKIAFTRG